MSRQAKVQSLDAVRSFQIELERFTQTVAQVLQQLNHECQRAVEWMENDRMVYWPAQTRRASDRLSEARINLERCQVGIRTEDRAPCTTEKKALEKAHSRLQLCEEKIRSTRHWMLVMRREADQFRTALAKTGHVAEVELPLAVARLEQIIASLEEYT